MPPTLDEKIADTESAMRAMAEGDFDGPRYSKLTARLAVLQAAKKEMDDEEDDDEEDDDDEEKKSKKSSKSAKKSEEKKAEEEEEEEEESSSSGKASAALSLLERVTGRTGDEAIGAAAAMFSRLPDLEKTTQQLVQSAKTAEKDRLLASLTKHVPQSDLKWLATQSLKTVRSFAENALARAPMVHTEEGELLVAKQADPKAGAFAQLSKAEQDIVTDSMAALPAKWSEERREKFREDSAKRILDTKSSTNGGGLY